MAYAGVIVTGSHDMVTQHARWSERTAEWLLKAVRAAVPTLGICYGHQLLAYACGGKVGDNPEGLEFGTVVVADPGGHEDALLREFRGPSRPTCVISSRSWNFRLEVAIATTRMDRVRGFFDQPLPGAQFHPEFDSRTARSMLRNRDALSRRGGQVPERVFVLHGNGERTRDFSALCGRHVLPGKRRIICRVRWIWTRHGVAPSEESKREACRSRAVRALRGARGGSHPPPGG